MATVFPSTTDRIRTCDLMHTWQGTGGFSLDASFRIHGSDRAGRERLLRYCARPPFALDRLRNEREPAGRSDDAGVRRIFYQPARPTPDGRTLLALSPLAFLGALSRLIPPTPRPPPPLPRRPGPNARLRARVTALECDVEIVQLLDAEGEILRSHFHPKLIASPCGSLQRIPPLFRLLPGPQRAVQRTRMSTV